MLRTWAALTTRQTSYQPTRLPDNSRPDWSHLVTLGPALHMYRLSKNRVCISPIIMKIQRQMKMYIYSNILSKFVRSATIYCNIMACYGNAKKLTVISLVTHIIRHSPPGMPYGFVIIFILFCFLFFRCQGFRMITFDHQGGPWSQEEVYRFLNPRAPNTPKSPHQNKFVGKTNLRFRTPGTFLCECKSPPLINSSLTGYVAFQV